VYLHSITSPEHLLSLAEKIPFEPFDEVSHICGFSRYVIGYRAGDVDGMSGVCGEEEMKTTATSVNAGSSRGLAR